MPAIVPADTLLDVALLKVGATIIGVTRGGIRRTPTREIKPVEFDGRRAAHVVGLDRIIDYGDRIETRVLEFSQASLDRLRNVSGDAPAVAKAGELYTSARYLTDVTMEYARGGGGTVKIVFPRALVLWTELTGEDKSEAEAAIAIEAALNYPTATTDDAPYTIVHSPAGAGGVTALSDTFTRTGDLHLSIADSGHVWTVHTGTFTTTGTRAKVTVVAAAPDYAFATVDLTVADFDYTFTTFVPAGALRAWTPFRFVDSNNMLMIEHDAGAPLVLYKRVAGTFTSLGSGGTGADGDVIRCNAVGTSITIYRNAVSAIAVTEAAFQTATRVGIGASAVDKEWDNVTGAAL